jgi:hypothetical protein
MAFEKRSLRVPVNRAIREDLHSVNRVSSPTGQITYRAFEPDASQLVGFLSFPQFHIPWPLCASPPSL